MTNNSLVHNIICETAPRYEFSHIVITLVFMKPLRGLRIGSDPRNNLRVNKIHSPDVNIDSLSDVNNDSLSV